MKKLLVPILAVAFVIPHTAHSQAAADSAAVLQTLDSWNRGWAEANAALAVEAYAEDADWCVLVSRPRAARRCLTGTSITFVCSTVAMGNGRL